MTQISINPRVLRRNDLDWLRVAAVLLLIPFHAALIFVADPNSIMYVKDSFDSTFFDRMAGFIHQFHMPLLFFIAGASSFFALAVRNTGSFLLERVKKLLIPAVFTILVLVPPMTYITQLSHGKNIAFWQHFMGFFRFDAVDLSGINGTFTPAHAWFILFLIIFSVISLPLFIGIRNHLPNSLPNKTAGFFEKPFALYLLLIPIAVTASIDLLGDKNPLYYFGIFILGYLLMTDARYQKAIDREAPISLILGTAFFVIRVLWNPNFAEWSLAWIGYGLMEQATRLFLLFGILGLGHRYIRSGGKVLAYLSKAAFPIYLLHLLITTLIAFFVIKIDAGIAVKYLIIISTSTLATIGMYEVFKRIKGLRFLLGIK